MYPRVVRATIMQKHLLCYGSPSCVMAYFSNGEYRELFEFYPEELHFKETEFLGLTYEEAFQVKVEKARAADLH